MSPDLSRWNRAGLRHFRYVDGNAATFLQTIVAQLAASFEPWGRGELAPWRSDGPAGTAQRWQQAAQAYAALQARPGSPALEIARSVARACHVLGSAIDAHANEGFIGTATQWEHLRRLVQMLDHAPRPAASASTPLVLQVKAGQPGTLRRGFKVKHTPDGGAPLVFETLEDLALAPALNGLRLQGWQRNPQPLAATDTLTLDGVVDGIQVGDALVIEHLGADRPAGSAALRPFLVAGVAVEAGHSVVRLASRFRPTGQVPWPLGDLLVHLNPSDRLALHGPAQGGQPPQDTDRSLVLAELPRGLKSAQVVYIGDGGDGGDGRHGVFARVVALQGRRLTLDRSLSQALPDTALADLRVGLARQIAVSRQIPDDGHRAALPLALRLAGDWRSLADSLVAHGSRRQGALVLTTLKVTLARYHPVTPVPEARHGHTDLLLAPLHGAAAPDNPQSLFVPPESLPWPIDRFLRNDLPDQKPFSHRLHTARAKQLGRGDLCAVLMGRRLTAGRVGDLSLTEQGTQLEVAGWTACPDQRFYLGQTVLQGHFKVRARLAGWNRNDTAVAGAQLTLAEASPEDSSAVERALRSGRRVVVEALDAQGLGLHAVHTTLAAIGRSGALLQLQLDTELPAGRFTIANTVVRANVVLAGHGETQAPVVLGSGDATASGQAFVFGQAGVSFVADAAQPSGVRADLRVVVDTETWTQVATLNHSAPTDPHYTVRVTEAGFLQLGFGDGVRGRRLPSGDNNLRVAYRRGTGAAGNQPPGCLTQAEHPDPRVAGIRQPLAAVGGNDVEDVASLRRSGPASVRTLERAVSLVDFENLAMSQSSVWQARAFAAPPRGRHTAVALVIVPAHGGLLGGLRQDLGRFIAEHAVAGVVADLLDFQAVPLHLHIALGIDPQRVDGQAVQLRVRQALQAALGLRQRRIGERLYLSEVVRIVEDIPGVAYSTCRFVHGGALLADAQWLDPGRRDAVLHLDPALSQLVMTVEPSA